MSTDLIIGQSKQPNLPKVTIEVIGDLPYYVPVPEGTIFAPSMIGAEPFQLEFIHFQPLRHPEDSKGENVDDRLGTFIRSRSRVLFPRNDLPSEGFRDEFEEKALEIANRALRAIQYKAYDHTIRHVARFENTLVRKIEFNPDGSMKPEIVASQKVDYGPYGVRLIATLTDSALRNLWWHFNALAPMHSAWFLIMDAKYHNANGDISRACLDLASALEINIEGLVDLYEYADPELGRIEFEEKSIYWKYDQGLAQGTGHSLHERPDLFVSLEYIYGIRNSIAHRWKPEFKLTARMESRSKYVDEHRSHDGHQLTTQEEIDQLIAAAEQIISHSIDLFKAKYGSM